MVSICIGLVLGAEELKPINWRVWAGKVERESGGGGPFQGLEDRLGFVDIRVGLGCNQSQRRRFISTLIYVEDMMTCDSWADVS